METFVGAKKVGCNKCFFCFQCLVEKEILYATESRITLEQALSNDVRCSSCGALLYTKEEKNNLTGQQKTEKIKNSL